MDYHLPSSCNTYTCCRQIDDQNPPFRPSHTHAHRAISKGSCHFTMTNQSGSLFTSATLQNRNTITDICCCSPLLSPFLERGRSFRRRMLQHYPPSWCVPEHFAQTRWNAYDSVVQLHRHCWSKHTTPAWIMYRYQLHILNILFSTTCHVHACESLGRDFYKGTSRLRRNLRDTSRALR